MAPITPACFDAVGSVLLFKWNRYYGGCQLRTVIIVQLGNPIRYCLCVGWRVRLISSVSVFRNPQLWQSTEVRVSNYVLYLSRYKDERQILSLGTLSRSQHSVKRGPIQRNGLRRKLRETTLPKFPRKTTSVKFRMLYRLSQEPGMFSITQRRDWTILSSAPGFLQITAISHPIPTFLIT